MKSMIKPTTQEHTLGCGVACVASILGISYQGALKYFNKENVISRGCYCSEIVHVLHLNGKYYKYEKIILGNMHRILDYGVIVFLEKSEEYPMGHYLVRANDKWMNPWVNYPEINPAKSDFEKATKGKVEYIIYPLEG